MRKLSLILFILLAFVFMSARILTPSSSPAPVTSSPHGDDFKINCDVCHSSAKGWKLDKEIYSFDHNTTAFPLEGQHQLLDCKLCHPTLKFKEAKTGCIDCHTDMHAQTVGPDCGRCHTPKSWIVNNITEIHQQSRFPLVGPHYTSDCSKCHKSASMLRFDPLGVECYDCHQADYAATNNPNHEAAKYSTNCTDCHSMNSFTWGANVDHSFFPLTAGHAIDCQKCHVNGTFSKLPTECVSCHQTNYNGTTNPNHVSLQLSTSCTDCHTTNPGWKPAQFTIHDTYFPIYSGKHRSPAWNSCSDCHTNAANYADYTCTSCHHQSDMDQNHSDVGGYLYSSPACFACHPTGSAEGGFNHNNSPFPLTGAHTTTPCASCHVTGYQGTSTVCSDCHISSYNQTTNPNHAAINIPNTCATCHTTNPGWNPATFPTHSNYYPLTGAHATIAGNCAACHQGNYNTTPNTCVGCHQTNYNQTTNPNHAAAQFPTDCEQCHNQNAWTPANWDHDGQYFPIYSGKHKNKWNVCADCHTNPGNYAVFTCTTCHQQSEMDPAHNGVAGYSFNSNACYSCHPTGNTGRMIRINTIKKD